MMLHHNMRFEPAVQAVNKLLQKRVIGDVLAFKSTLTHRGPQAWSPTAKWFFDKSQAGGGALMDLGPHVFDLLCFFLKGKPRIIGAAAVQPKNGEGGKGEIHCSCLLGFQGGAVGTVTAGWADTSYQNHIYFFGSKGTLYLDLAKGEPITLELHHKPGKTFFPRLRRGHFPSIYEHFLGCVKNNKKPLVSGVDGLKTVELIEAAYRFIR